MAAREKLKECPKCRGNGCPNKVTYSIEYGYMIDGHSCVLCNNTGKVAIGYDPTTNLVVEGK